MSVAINRCAAAGSFRLSLVSSVCLAFLLSACGGGGGGGGGGSGGGGGGGQPTTYTIGGSVSGLSGTVVLQNSGGNNLSLTANGPFTFSTAVNSGAAYAVTVLTQPTGQTCAVTSGSGTATANVTTVAVSCTTNTFSVGGTLAGLANGGTVILQNSGGNNLSLTANGNFAFTTKVNSGAAYNVTVLTQPAGQTCTVTNPTGNASANVTNVAVNCAATMVTVGGTLTGLGAGATVILQNNGGDNRSLTANGNYSFATALSPGAQYNVSVLTQPAGQTCTVSNAAGKAAANVTNVAVDCKNTFSIGGTISGLNGTVVLQNNLGDSLTVTGGTSFTFPQGVQANQPYFVTAFLQPTGQTCQVTNNIGTATANVSNVTVTCTNNPAALTIGGNVTGLGAGKTLVVQNNGGDNRTISANGTYTFATPVALGAPYVVTVLTQPVGQTCMLNPANPSGLVAPVGNAVNIACADGATTHTVGGSITGLTGAGLKLFITANNTTLSVPANATSFTFPNGLVPTTEYRIGITAQPAGQTCVITNSGDEVGTTDIANAKVTCINNTTDVLGGVYQVPSDPGKQAYIAFFPDGVYVFATVENDPTCGGTRNGNGVEMGVYSYSQATGAFAIKNAVLDNNGECGVWDNGTEAVGTVQKTGSGVNTALVFTPSAPGSAPGVLTHATSVAGSIVGSYVAGLARDFIVFGNDGHYLEAQVSDDSIAGVEYACYTASAGNITPNLSCPGAVDTNSDTGLSDSDGVPIPFNLVTPYITFIGSGAETVVLFRTVPN